MGVIDVPQWLPAAFVRSVLAVGATAPREEIEATCRRLLDRWQASDRHFHNLRHLIDVLARVDELAEETHHPDTVRLAAWYHGAVFSSMPDKAYSRSGGEDEAASADLAREELRALGVPDRVTERIAELILNLKRHDASRRDIDCLALCDADLSVLAAEPQKYRAYRKAVRAEYAHLPARHYLEARTAIVTKLLNRREIFVSPMGAQWEDAARENLSAELERLRAELAELGDADPATSVAAAEAAQGTIVEHTHRADERASHTFTSTQRGGTPTARASTPPSSPTGGTPGDAPTGGTPDDAPTGGARDAAPAAARAANRPSSLEALPDEGAKQRRRTDEPGASGREEVARSSRERIEEAVRQGRERVERNRVQRERITTARAERAEALAPSRERRTRRVDDGASPLTPISPASAPSPASAGAGAAPEGRAGATALAPANGKADTAAESRADGTSGNRTDVRSAESPDEASPTHAAPEHRAAVDSVPRMIEPEPLTGELEQVREAPLHGIEREPDLLSWRRRKDRKDRKKGRSEH